MLYNLLSAFKRVGLPEDLHAARPKRLRFLMLNTVGKVVPHAREILMRFAHAISHTLADFPRAIFSLLRQGVKFANGLEVTATTVDNQARTAAA